MNQLKIVYKSVKALVPYANNARTHTESQVELIARSIQEFGFVNPVLIGEDNTVIAGHGRVMAANIIGMKEVPCIVLGHLSERSRKALVIADNKIALRSSWDMEKLSAELSDLAEFGMDLSLTGFDDGELDSILRADIIIPEFKASPNLELVRTEPAAPSAPPVYSRSERAEPDQQAEAVPVESTFVTSQIGDVWILGSHRVMCGDSTDRDHVATLMDGAVATLVHADPPYGMGKQSDGVANDNIYREKLDQFQMDWWRAFRTHLAKNASAYIWGNAPDLWRLWYKGGLGDSEVLEFRNEIVWDKKNIPGMGSPDLTQYSITTERCLFFQIGEQFLGNVNTNDFPEEWEAIRAYMESQAVAAGLNASGLKSLLGIGMYNHWFTKSQFTLMPAKHYKTVAEAFPGCFTRPWAELKAEWDEVKSGPNSVFKKERSFFNNSHDVMRDVWEFPRVNGEERHGHATPKPVAMMERCIISSSQEGDIVVEPFGGSGSTLIACERVGRTCMTMELTPSWVDVIIQRWQDYTGGKAIHASGKTFDEVRQLRQHE